MSRTSSLFGTESFDIIVHSNGTTTEAVVANDGQASYGRKTPVARGVAKRRKGETSRPQLGSDLAVYRAVVDLARTLRRQLITEANLVGIELDLPEIPAA